MTDKPLFVADETIFRASEAVLDAASKGKLEALRDALAKGGNSNYSRFGICPSLSATSSDHLECLKLLVEDGAGLDIPNKMGWTAIHDAATKEDGRFLDVILASEYEQDPCPVDNAGWTPLRVAIESGLPEAVTKILAALPVQLDVSDAQGVTPIMAAALKKNEEILEQMLLAGADRSLIAVDGRTLGSCVFGWSEGEDLVASYGIVASMKPSPSPKNEVIEPELPQEAINPFGLGSMKKASKGP